LAQLYNSNNPLRARSFWKTGIIMGIAHGAAIFFIIYYSAVREIEMSISQGVYPGCCGG